MKQEPVPVVPEERESELRSKWEHEVNDSRRKEAEHIVAEKTKKGETLDQEDKDEILNNLLRKVYPEKEWRERLFKEKKVQFVKDIIQRLVVIVEHSPLTAWNYREFQFFWNGGMGTCFTKKESAIINS